MKREEQRHEQHYQSSRPLKVLHVTATLSGGGAETQLFYLSTALASKGYEVHIAYLWPGHETGYLKSGVHLHKLPGNSSYDIRTLFGLFSLIRRLRPKIVQSWILHSDVCAGIGTRLLKTPWLLREPDAPELRNRRNVRFFIHDLICSSAESIVANSESGASFWRRKAPKARVKVIRNGFPVKSMAIARDLSPLVSRLESKQFILCVGRHEVQKNIPNLIRAVALLPRSIYLVLCGNGQCTQEYIDLIESLGIHERVLLLGHSPKEQVLQLMQCAACCTCVSHHEGMPNSVVEAMLSKSPLVVSDIEPHRELLGENAAIFVNHRDPVQIKIGLDHALNDTDGNERRVTKAFALASQFNIERMVQEYRILYRDLLRRQ